jgi:hypothetical protein
MNRFDLSSIRSAAAAEYQAGFAIGVDTRYCFSAEMTLALSSITDFP